MVKLSKTQQRLVKRLAVGESVIKGEAQVGKTAFATARMLYLLNQEAASGEKILVVSRAESLEAVQMVLKERENEKNISLFDQRNQDCSAEIYSIEGLLKQLEVIYLNLEDFTVAKRIPEAFLLEAIKATKKQYPKVKWLKVENIDFLQAEYEWIYACGYTAWEDYQKARRKGSSMKLPYKGSGRKAIWFIKEQVDHYLKTQKLITKVQRDWELACTLKTIELVPYKHMIIDDAHLLTKVQLEILSLLNRHQKGEKLFLVQIGEEAAYTAWLGQGYAFTTIGYGMTGRIKTLKKLGDRPKKSIKVKEQGLTPLELFLLEKTTAQKILSEEAWQVDVKEEKLLEEEQKASPVPWYIDTYRYVNKLTGIETIFQQDISAGETYIDAVKQEELQSLPLYSDIAAGAPIEIVEEECSLFKLPSELTGYRKNTYMLHVQGDSMIGAEINDGDYVVIQAGSVGPKEIGAVYYQGAITLKRIIKEKGQVLLMSENPKYPPIMIEDEDFRVMGRLIGVLKQEKI